MKTSVTMQRNMGGLTVHQRTGDGMFNDTTLAKQYYQSKGLKRGKEVSEFLKLDKTKEFIDALHIEINDNTTKIVLSKNGKNGGTWMHPYLFIDFAMWLNPTFKVKVIQFVYDELIKNRNEAGDTYPILSASGMKLRGYDFKEVAKALQWIAFNKTGKNLRQTASQDELKCLADTQIKLAFAIDMGYITSYADLIKSMRKIYHDKNSKF